MTTEVYVLVRQSRIALLVAALVAGVALPALASESGTAEPVQTKLETATAQLDPTAGKAGSDANAPTSGTSESSIAPTAARRLSPRGSGHVIARRTNTAVDARRPALILGVRF
jgi:hypothetical protein